MYLSQRIDKAKADSLLTFLTAHLDEDESVLFIGVNFQSSYYFTRKWRFVALSSRRIFIINRNILGGIARERLLTDFVRVKRSIGTIGLIAYAGDNFALHVPRRDSDQLMILLNEICSPTVGKTKAQEKLALSTVERKEKLARKQAEKAATSCVFLDCPKCETEIKIRVKAELSTVTCSGCGRKFSKFSTGTFFGEVQAAVALKRDPMPGVAKRDSTSAMPRPGLVGSQQIVCPHCQVRGLVKTKPIRKSSGISGGKAAAGLLTGGFSIWMTGLSRMDYLTQAKCGNCRSSWTF